MAKEDFEKENTMQSQLLPRKKGVLSPPSDHSVKKPRMQTVNFLRSTENTYIQLNSSENGLHFLVHCSKSTKRRSMYTTYDN